MNEQQQMMRNSHVMASVTALSRVFGLLREMFVAAVLGTTRLADVWMIAFMLPNLFRRFLAEGAMSSAFVPLLAELRAAGDVRAEQEFARAFFSLIALVSSLVVTVLILILPWGLPWVLRLFAATAENEVQQACVLPTQIMFPYLVFISLAAVCQGMLNVHNRYALPAFTPILLNLSIIGCGLALRHHLSNPVWALATGVLLGGFLQLAVQWYRLFSMGFRLHLTLKCWTPKTREAVALWWPITLGAGVYQVNIIVSQSIAIGLFTGALSALNYSNRIMELVLGVFAASITTSLLPVLSQQRTRQDMTSLNHTFWRAMEGISMITIPASIGMLLAGPTGLSILFQRGEFDQQSLNLTYGVLIFHGMALVPIAWYRVISQVFFAFKRVRIAVRLAVLGMLSNVALCLFLPPWFHPLNAHCGIALATLTSSWIMVLLGLATLRHAFQINAPPSIMTEMFKMILASASFVPLWLPVTTQPLPWLPWLLKVVASCAIYGIMSWVLKIRVFRDTLIRFRGKPSDMGSPC